MEWTRRGSQGDGLRQQLAGQSPPDAGRARRDRFKVIAGQQRAAAPGIDCIIDLSQGGTGGLDSQERAIATLAALVTQGKEAHIEQHIDSALEGGIAPGKIIEVMALLITCVDLQRVISGLLIADRIFRQRGMGGIGAVGRAQ